MSRLKKWTENFNAENAGINLMPYKEQMREMMAQHFETAVKLEEIVKKIMGKSGLPTWHNVPYHNFARKVYKHHTRYSGKMLAHAIATEISLAQQILLERKLLLKIKREIEKFVLDQSKC
jgi:hypothetical protein